MARNVSSAVVVLEKQLHLLLMPSSLLVLVAQPEERLSNRPLNWCSALAWVVGRGGGPDSFTIMSECDPKVFSFQASSMQ